MSAQYYTGVSETAQKVFEGDVVFSILINREKTTNREHNISFDDFLGHLRDPRVLGIILYQDSLLILQSVACDSQRHCSGIT